MLNIKFVDKIDDIQFHEKSYERFNFPLFHGTKKHMLMMPDEERNNHFSLCKKLLMYTKGIVNDIPNDVLDKYYTDFIHSQGRETYINSYSFDACLRTSMYEYDSFYVSFNLETASDYSNNLGGELSTFAFDCAHMITTLGLDVPKDIKTAVNHILDYYEKYKDDERIIVVITSVEFTDLVTEEGCPFLKLYGDQKEELVKKIDDLQDEYSIDRFGVDNRGYRIHNPEKYQMYAIPINLIEELKAKITNVGLKHYLQEAIRTIKRIKDRSFSTDYHDERYSDGSFKLMFEKHSKHYIKELEFPVVFHPIDFSKDSIPQDEVDNIPESDSSEEHIAFRLAVRICNAYRQAKYRS